MYGCPLHVAPWMAVKHAARYRLKNLSKILVKEGKARAVWKQKKHKGPDPSAAKHVESEPP